MDREALISQLLSSETDEVFMRLYGRDPSVLSRQKHRYEQAVDRFSERFPEYRDLSIFSAPGRTEIGGNHTDHQHGHVLAAAIDLDAIAVVSKSDEPAICLLSEGYPEVRIDLSDLSVREEEKGTTAALIRGVAAQFAGAGVSLSGLCIYMTSDVLSGSGLSSSAAFEVLLGTILDTIYNSGKAGAQAIARYGQIAENEYFGKASGLMDQMVSSVGGLVEIDFADPDSPKIDTHQYDLEKVGFALIITDTKGSHADLSAEYSAIPEEMRKVAQFFGKAYLAEVGEAEFYASMQQLREAPDISDRAILRAAHFFADDARAQQEAAALDQGDFPRFLELICASGESSANLLQNLSCSGKPQEQAIPLALMLSRRVLQNEGACRVHGGGFAGTIQAFVPQAKVQKYIATLEGVFGEGACHILHFRPCGGVQIL